MASHTGILGVFDLFKYDKGFVLQLPRKESPKTVPEFAPQAKLLMYLKKQVNGQICLAWILLHRLMST